VGTGKCWSKAVDIQGGSAEIHRCAYDVTRRNFISVAPTIHWLSSSNWKQINIRFVFVFILQSSKHKKLVSENWAK
jgi:hypothetical protein